MAYSFDTNGVHMVMLGRWADPGVLQWLQRDLAAVGTSAYVVLGIHYPLDNSDYNDLDTWYKPADRNAMGAVIAGYKVVAILNGHTHVANTYKLTPAHAAGAPAYTYDCIDDGSLGRVGDFGVMHITLSKLTYAQYLPTFNKTGDWTGGGFTNVRLSKDLGS